MVIHIFMEQHPVPQNVTTFQFRLIGDMTIKQFGYLAGGAILAYICYRLPLPVFFTWPLAALFGLLGIGLAFVPIEERPMDIWVFSFLKSIYHPTQFIWQQLAPPASPAPSPPPTTPSTAGPKSVSPAGGKLQQFFPRSPDFLAAQTQHQSLAAKNAAPAPAISPAPPAPRTPSGEALSAQAKALLLEQRLTALEIELKGKAAAEQQVLELQQQLTKLLSDKNHLEQELAALKRQANFARSPFPAAPFINNRDSITAPKTPGLRPPVNVPATPPGGTVKIIPPLGAVRAGLPKLTIFPNIVTGIIKDNAGTLLPGVLITVRGKDDVPLRALKTNKLGQFAASTQLPDGVYFVEVEDPRGRYNFDRAQITLNGTVMPPLEITAKSQKELNRARLAQEIFGKPMQ